MPQTKQKVIVQTLDDLPADVREKHEMAVTVVESVIEAHMDSAIEKIKNVLGMLDLEAGDVDHIFKQELIKYCICMAATGINILLENVPREQQAEIMGHYNKGLTGTMPEKYTIKVNMAFRNET